MLHLCNIHRARMPAMQWDDVRVLLALLRATNLTEAASRLSVDRSTISRRLAALERSVGAKLFARTRDGLRPTPVALGLLPHAERMELDAMSLVGAAKAGERKAGGVVRVATTEGLGALLVLEGLLAVRQQHPDLVIELSGGNKSLDLGRGEADVALRLAPVREASLRVRRVARMAIGLFASPAYLRARGAARTKSELAGHDVLLPAGELLRLPESKWLVSRSGMRVVFRSNSMPSLVAAAVSGLGMVPLGLPWGDHEPRLERVMLLEHIPRRSLWLVTREDGASHAAVSVVCDRIAAICAKSFGSAR